MNTLEDVVKNLNGYFLAVKRVCGNSLDFWAEVIAIENNIDEALNGYMAKLDNTEQTNSDHSSY